ncbi:MAG: hypothetical protein ACTSRI_09285 [Promethearchaeota archaeon]
MSIAKFSKGGTYNLIFLKTDQEVYYIDEKIEINASWELNYNIGLEFSYIQIQILVKCFYYNIIIETLDETKIFLDTVEIDVIKKEVSCELIFFKTNQEVYYIDEKIEINASWELNYNIGLEFSYIQIQIYDIFNNSCKMFLLQYYNRNTG